MSTTVGRAKSIWVKLKNEGFSDESAAGILGNLQQENSDFDYQKGGLNKAYGIFQFDPPDNYRKYLKKHKKKDSIESQIDYVLSILGGSFKTWSGGNVWYDYKLGKKVSSKPSHDSWAWWGEKAYTLKEFKNITGGKSGAALCADIFCRVYERAGTPMIKNRKSYAKKWYAEFTGIRGDGGSTSDDSKSQTLDLGHQILKTARMKIGSPIASSKEKDYAGPDVYSMTGLAYSSYESADVSIPKRSTAEGLYQALLKKKDVRTIKKLSNSRAADLFFYKENGKMKSVSISNGKGGRIYSTGTIISEEGSTEQKPNAILRVLKDNQVAEDELKPGDISYTPPKIYEAYKSNIEKALSEYATRDQKYGYLIETKTNKTFKFYIPEFTESAGANWNTIPLMGRSVNMFSYDSTSSRTVTISLDLYAGEGLYKKSTLVNSVKAMHADANFVKSLEYPDYTSAIVRPPSQVLLILGTNFKMLGVVSGVSVDHMKPLDSHSRSMYIKLSFTVTQVAANPPDADDIRNGKMLLT